VVFPNPPLGRGWTQHLFFVILNPLEVLGKGVKNLAVGKEDPSPEKPQDDLIQGVILNLGGRAFLCLILNLSKAFRREVKNLCENFA
jgi:hypothetical protein